VRSARSSILASRRQRGISIAESLVAFVVAAGTAAAAQLQSRLHLAGDVARERSEALRIGADAIEEMRSFVALDASASERTYAAIASGESSIDASSTSSASSASSPRGSYRIERRIDDAGFAATKSARVNVRWDDRSGNAHDVVLDSFIAAVAPAYSGSLRLGVGSISAAARGAADRAPGVPLTARNLGDGRSAWKPVEGGTTALGFDNRSGAVVGRCDGVATTAATRDLSSASLATCMSGRWLLVAGTIRFSSAAPPSSLAASDAPFPTRVAITLRNGAYPAPAACFSEARKTSRSVVEGSLEIVDVPLDADAGAAGAADVNDGGDRFIAWHCIVAPRADGRWSGRIELIAEGWTIGSSGATRRVCRYLSNAGAIDANIATGGDDIDVSAALIGRNFLVVRGSESCPSETRTARTEPHQP